MAAASPRAPHEAGRAAGCGISPRFPRRLFAKLLETSPKLAMDVAAAALPAFVALWLLSPWPLLGSVQGQFSAGEWSWGSSGSVAGPSLELRGREDWLIAGAGAGDPGGVRLGFVGVQAGARSVLGVCVRRDAGPRALCPWAQVTFTLLTHCFRGWPSPQTAQGVLPRACGDLAFPG